jgi:hypothetical protein
MRQAAQFPRTVDMKVARVIATESHLSVDRVKISAMTTAKRVPSTRDPNGNPARPAAKEYGVSPQEIQFTHGEVTGDGVSPRSRNSRVVHGRGFRPRGRAGTPVLIMMHHQIGVDIVETALPWVDWTVVGLNGPASKQARLGVAPDANDRLIRATGIPGVGGKPLAEIAISRILHVQQRRDVMLAEPLRPIAPMAFRA